MYRALYRKWRPQRFEDVVAQRGIVTALRNQIATGRVDRKSTRLNSSHAT